MIATVRSATILGARGHPVSVEVHVAKGIPGFAMLGLPDESCREARDRVRAAIITSGFGWPDKKITVNLAPPSYRKTGSGLDLPIAVGLLVAFDVIPFDVVRNLAFVGELGLDGTIRRVPGIAPMVGVHPDDDWVVPADALTEARIVGRGLLRPIDKLDRLVEALTGASSWPEYDPTVTAGGGGGRAARHGGRARPAARAIGARGGRRRRSPPVVRRAARRRQDDAGAAPAGAAARSRPGHGARDHDDPLGVGRSVTRRWARHPPALPCAASHQLAAVPGRRRIARAAPRRDFARSRRRALPRRDGSVSDRLCSTACARRWSWGASWSAGSRAIGCRCRLDSS